MRELHVNELDQVSGGTGADFSAVTGAITSTAQPDFSAVTGTVTSTARPAEGAIPYVHYEKIL